MEFVEKLEDATPGHVMQEELHTGGFNVYYEIDQRVIDHREKIANATARQPVIDKQNFAGEEIRRLHPSWRQLNSLNRRLEFMEKIMSGESLTVTEQEEMDRIKHNWLEIKTIRNDSNV